MKELVENMISTLIDSGKYLTAEELADKIGCSESNIRHNISLVREELGKHGLVLKNVSPGGLRIESEDGDPDAAIERLKEALEKDVTTGRFRRNYIIDTLLNFEKNYSVSLFVDELYVSKSVIRSDLALLNEQFRKFGISFNVRKSSGIIVEGHEFAIRQGIIYFQNRRLWRKDYLSLPQAVDPRISDRAWTFITQYYTDDLKRILKIQEALHEVEAKIGADLTDISFGRLLEYILISQNRIRRGNAIRSELPGGQLPVPELYLEAADLVKKVLPRMEEKEWGFERTYMAARIYVTEKLLSTFPAAEEYREAAEAFLREILHSITAGQTEPDGLTDEILKLLDQFRFRSSYRIYDWTDIHRRVREDYAGIYAVCLLNLNILEEATGLTFSKDDISELVLYIARWIETHKKRAVLVTGASEEVAFANIMRLRNEFPNLDFQGIESHREFSFAKHREDLVISTVNLKRTAPNLICVTKHLTDEDIDRIRTRVAEMSSGRDILHRIYREQLVLEIDAGSREEALRKITAGMEEAGCVEECFFEEVMNNDRLYPTLVGNGVAIPHAYRTGVRESAVAVVRLGRKVPWQEEERAELIFCFAIGEETSEDIKKIFRHMYYVLRNKNLIRRIKQSEDKKEIISALLNNC